MKPDSRLIFLTAALLLTAGCGSREPEITELQRKEAAHLAAEAEFAITLRDYGRAETTLQRVVELVPTNGAYWITLGSVRKRGGKAGAARDAYQQALRVYEKEAKARTDDPDPWLKQIYVLALLGRSDDARKLAQEMTKKFPDNRSVRIFNEDKQFDQMLADRTFREIAL